MSMHSVRIPDKLDHEIVTILGPNVSWSDVIRHALTDYVKRERFRQIRKQVLPFAEARGLLIDEDIFENL